MVSTFVSIYTATATLVCDRSGAETLSFNSMPRMNCLQDVFTISLSSAVYSPH